MGKKKTVPVKTRKPLKLADIKDKRLRRYLSQLVESTTQLNANADSLRDSIQAINSSQAAGLARIKSLEASVARIDSNVKTAFDSVNAIKGVPNQIAVNDGRVKKLAASIEDIANNVKDIVETTSVVDATTCAMVILKMTNRLDAYADRLHSLNEKVEYMLSNLGIQRKTSEEAARNVR